MISNISSWKSLTENMHSNMGMNSLRTNGKDIVLLRTPFPENPGAILGGGILILVGAIQFISFGIPQTPSDIFNPAYIFIGVFVLGGIWMMQRGREAISFRKENGGIHPNDTLFVFDATHRIVTKQKNLQEERLASFEDVRLEIQRIHTNHIRYNVKLMYSEKAETIATSGSFKEAEKCLKK